MDFDNVHHADYCDNILSDSEKQALKTWTEIFITDLEKEKASLIKQEKEYLSLQQKSLALQDMILQKKEVYQQLVNQIKKEQSENLHRRLQQINRRRSCYDLQRCYG